MCLSDDCNTIAKTRLVGLGMLYMSLPLVQVESNGVAIGGSGALSLVVVVVLASKAVGNHKQQEL